MSKSLCINLAIVSGFSSHFYLKSKATKRVEFSGIFATIVRTEQKLYGPIV